VITDGICSTRIKWTEEKVQDALTAKGQIFDFRRYSSVPNVSYGLLYTGEADLICLSGAGVFHEVEIKVSKQDMISDLQKGHAHNHEIVQRLWYAFPGYLQNDIEPLVPIWAGIITVYFKIKNGNLGYKTVVVRRPHPKLRTTNRQNRKPTQEEIIKFLRLGVMRMWSRRTRHSNDEQS